MTWNVSSKGNNRKEGLTCFEVHEQEQIKSVQAKLPFHIFGNEPAEPRKNYEELDEDAALRVDAHNSGGHVRYSIGGWRSTST